MKHCQLRIILVFEQIIHGGKTSTIIRSSPSTVTIRNAYQQFAEKSQALGPSELQEFFGGAFPH